LWDNENRPSVSDARGKHRKDAWGQRGVGSGMGVLGSLQGEKHINLDKGPNGEGLMVYWRKNAR